MREGVRGKGKQGLVILERKEQHHIVQGERVFQGKQGGQTVAPAPPPTRPPTTNARLGLSKKLFVKDWYIIKFHFRNGKVKYGGCVV